MPRRPAGTHARPRPAPAATEKPAAAGLFPALADLGRPLEPFLVPLLVACIARGVFFALIPNASEDAYITYRYARNLANGFGLTFNPGERVMGFSSPLWTLWNALGYLVTQKPMIWSRLSAIVADLGVILVLGQLVRRQVGLAAAWCFNLFFAAWPYFASIAVSGMENGVLFALIVFAGALAERRSPATGPALAAVALCRPEGLVAAAVLAIVARPRDALIGLAIVALAMFGLFAYFGSPVPQSMLAKAKLYGTPGPWAGRHWWEWLSPAPLGRWSGLPEGSFLTSLSLLLGPAALIGGIELARRPRSALSGIGAAALVVFLGYSLLGIAFFWWYLAVPLAGIALLAAVGLPRIVRGPTIYAAIALLLAGTWSMQPRLYLGRAQNEYAGFVRAAQILRSDAQAGQKVMLEPIGIVGYSAPVVIIDEIGLVTPSVMRRRLEGAGWYADVVARERPDWLLVRGNLFAGGEAFAGAGAPFRNSIEREGLLAHYARYALVDSTPGSVGLVMFRRVN